MLTKKILKILSFGIWSLLAYIHLFLALFLRLIPKLRNKMGPKFEERLKFERKNRDDEGCKSFFLTNEVAKICFQVASEGEFEQIRWILDEILKSNQLVEVIFTSPSVEHRILKLHQQWQKQVRYLRTPIVTLSTPNLSNWITAPQVVMVRYDFYPMIMTLSEEKKLILLWFFRPRDRKTLLAALKWKLILPLFKYIVASNTDDWWWLKSQVDFKRLMPFALDLRSLSIFDRIEKSTETLDNHFEDFSFLFSALITQHAKSIIHGNAYISELNYLSDLNWKKSIVSKNIILAIVAHHPNSINEKTILESYNIPCYEITSGIKRSELTKILQLWQNDPGILLFTGKGFLLELYSLFKVALVGGGFKQDTHSLLEPYLAGATVYCGPNIYRSSEYFQIKDFDGQKLYSLATIEQWKCDCLLKILSLDISDIDSARINRLTMMKQAVLEQSKVLLKFFENK